jgi:5'-methylthioinosine phosphorylase
MQAIIGGSGLDTADFVTLTNTHSCTTPYGNPSDVIREGRIHNHAVLFLARHGELHTIAPHQINYRANIDALKQLGVTDIIAVAAVGGIAHDIAPQAVVIPDQIIDYTWGRAHTFFDAGTVEHIKFGCPYSQMLRQKLINAAIQAKVNVRPHGVYAVTQGPRLETDAEIRRLARDGGEIVGMTAMPEAALAREAGINYATLAISANWAAGIDAEPVNMEQIHHNLATGMNAVHAILQHYFKQA